MSFQKSFHLSFFRRKAPKRLKRKLRKNQNKKAEDKIKSEKSENPAQKAASKSETVSEGATATEAQKAEQPSSDKGSKDKKADKPAEQKKPNYIKNIWDKDGIVGIMLFVSNMVESASGAISTLFRGFHIYSLYVKILVGGGDADTIARAYGKICKYYYPLKGAIINGMKVDNYNDWIAPDFIMPQNEYGLQFIGSLSVGTILHVVLSAGKIFVVNLIKDK